MLFPFCYVVSSAYGVECTRMDRETQDIFPNGLRSLGTLSCSGMWAGVSDNEQYNSRLSKTFYDLCR